MRQDYPCGFSMKNSFGNILKNISAHYKRMELIRPKWEQKEYLSVREMLFETVNKNQRIKNQYQTWLP